MDPNSYIDGYVLAVPIAQRESYRQHAVDAARVFRKYGALSLVETWGDDVPQGKVTSLPMAVKCQPDETGRLSWTVWPAKATRDQGQAAFMADIRTPKQTPPDRQRMIFGGLRERVSARRIGRPALAKTPLPPPSTEQLCC